MARGFLISEGFRDKINATIARVDGTPYGQGAAGVSPRFESIAMHRRGFRVCTFTGTWTKLTQKVVTFRGVTSTPNTVVAENIFATVGGSGTKNCAIAKDGTAWYLIAAEC